MAVLAFYVGGYHLATYLKRRSAVAHLPFALMCLSVSAYDGLCAGLYNASSLTEGVLWQRWQLIAISSIAVCLGWFVCVVTNVKSIWLLRGVTGWYALLGALTWLLPESLTVDASRHDVKRVDLFGLPSITYQEGALGPLFTLTIASSILLYFGVVFLLLSRSLRGPKGTALGMVLGQVVYFGSVVNDALVAASVYPFVYLSEYAFLVVIVAMAHALQTEFVSVHTSLENLNRELELRVCERTAEISKLNAELSRMVDVDALTGAYNRRFLDRYLELEARRVSSLLDYDAGGSRSESMDFCVALFDLDNFKRINDQLGHAAGDMALVQFSDVVRELCFSRDVFCRYGGEEFVLILPQTTLAGAIQAVEKIRSTVSARLFRLTGADSAHRLTVSIGVAAFTEQPQQSARQMLELADSRLLQAKATGKNRVVAGEPLPTAPEGGRAMLH